MPTLTMHKPCQAPAAPIRYRQDPAATPLCCGAASKVLDTLPRLMDHGRSSRTEAVSTVNNFTLEHSFAQLLVLAKRTERTNRTVTFYDQDDKPLEQVVCISINSAKRLNREFQDARK